ncbi:hypothetical protein CANARDRAFT_26336 [[Candida] arabinofermentans NRRL YB-2248]|uniref:Kinesin motor domain-containing protein n=1 Tax=[Candida] arabinofermentans NRRL YB-2248 TaxID=983967 RepID=A0A1E4T8W0_9ASCO|nr:hypothetical protein CANARDRAFT_26336 [[Candida] arabinofermentans NRRL YB-2248]
MKNPSPQRSRPSRMNKLASSDRSSSPTKSIRTGRSVSPVKSQQPSSSAHLQGNLLSQPIKNTNIKVIVRFRPENEMEISNNSTNIVTYDDDNRSVLVSTTNSTNTFTFDHIFGEQASQEDIFGYSIRQTTNDLALGYNGTVLCYGQTGSGKSHTMMGQLEDDDLKGLIPRIFEQVFQCIQDSSNRIEYIVGVSYLEIYNDSLQDLLNPSNNNKLSISENKEDGIQVKGSETLYVAELKDVYEILEKGNKNRSVGSTNMNEQSSRSHAILKITLTSMYKDNGITKIGNLFLVDLAGSEKIDKTGASGRVLEEAKKINSSLSALGNVINSLTDGESTHIPYRDSKLTRILQESLGGNSRTTLIINCSPSSYNEQETLSTLRFGSRAKKIKNTVHVNSELSTSELKRRYLEERESNEQNQLKMQKITSRNEYLEKENAQLREELQKYKELVNLQNNSDSSIANESMVEMAATQNMMAKELENKCVRISELEEELNKSEQAVIKLDALHTALSQFSSHIEQVENQNKQLRKDIDSLQSVSEAKNQKIEELERQIREQEKLVEHDSSVFEEKLTGLKTRMSGAKVLQRSQMMNGGKIPHPSSAGTSVGKENAIDDSDATTMKQSMKNRIGLNLRIVKPMRGGQQDD